MSSKKQTVIMTPGDATIAAVLVAVDPLGLGGVLVRGTSGPVRDAWLANLRKNLPSDNALRKLPMFSNEDRLIGGLDIASTLRVGRPMIERGLLADADGAILILSSSERFSPQKAAIVAAAMDTGEIAIERNGLTTRSAARFCLIALDEGDTDEEVTPRALVERLAFHVDLSDDAAQEYDARDGVWSARLRLPEIKLPDALATAICEAAVGLGIASLRAPLFALKAARVHCAFDGRTIVSQDDAALAARLVLAPRATRLPSSERPIEGEQSSSQQRHPRDEEDEPQPSADELTDIILEAVKAVLPPGLFERADATAGGRAAGRSDARVSAKQTKARRGRPAGTEKGDPGRGGRLNLVETLRAAAPWQRLRIAGASEMPKVRVRREDFRVNRYRRRSETTAIFAVDASGSAALHRLAEAKGAVELLLADCYVRRDKIALVAFRGKSADILLPPTRSLQRAKRSLAALPGGGGTPLCAAIEASLTIAETIRRSGGNPILVFLTDGRANISRDGSAGHSAAMAEALEYARLVRTGGFKTLVIDVSPQPGEAARTLATTMAGKYVALPHANAGVISHTVSQAMRP